MSASPSPDLQARLKPLTNAKRHCQAPSDAYDIPCPCCQATAKLVTEALREAAASRPPSPSPRRACECSEPDPVMQADQKFYCYQCSFETGARPRLLPEMAAPPPLVYTCHCCGLTLTRALCEECGAQIFGDALPSAPSPHDDHCEAEQPALPVTGYTACGCKDRASAPSPLPQTDVRANALRDALCYILSATGGSNALERVIAIAKDALARDNEAWDRAAASAPSPQEAREAGDLGLTIDMLDADRLRQWADHLSNYGPDVSHWGSCVWVAQKMRAMADGIEQAVRDIGTLRQPACRCGVRAGVSHYCSALWGHAWVGGNAADRPLPGIQAEALMTNVPKGCPYHVPAYPGGCVDCADATSAAPSAPSPAGAPETKS